jgi:hypothetical protein
MHPCRIDQKGHNPRTTPPADGFCFLRPSEMNSSYNEVLQRSRRAWKFQRLELVLEFTQDNLHVHPLSIPRNLYVLFSAVLGCWRPAVARLPLLKAWDEFYRKDRNMAALHEEVCCCSRSSADRGVSYCSEVCDAR